MNIHIPSQLHRGGLQPTHILPTLPSCVRRKNGQLPNLFGAYVPYKGAFATETQVNQNQNCVHAIVQSPSRCTAPLHGPRSGIPAVGDDLKKCATKDVSEATKLPLFFCIFWG